MANAASGLWVQRAQGRRKTISVVVLSIVFGAVFGLVAYLWMFTGSEAVSIVEVGRIGSREVMIGKESTMTGSIEPVEVLVERMQSTEFARAVADDSGQEDAVRLLPSTQFGGKGRLRTRVLKDGTQIEIRVWGVNDERALSLAGAVDSVLIKQHEKIFAPFYVILSERAENVQANSKSLAEIDERLAEKLSALTTSSADLSMAPILLAAKAQSSRDLLELQNSAAQVKADLLSPNTFPTRVVSSPVINRPVLASPLLMLAVGALAGLLLGVLVLTIRSSDT